MCDVTKPNLVALYSFQYYTKQIYVTLLFFIRFLIGFAADGMV